MKKQEKKYLEDFILYLWTWWEEDRVFVGWLVSIVGELEFAVPRLLVEGWRTRNAKNMMSQKEMIKDRENGHATSIHQQNLELLSHFNTNLTESPPSRLSQNTTISEMRFLGFFRIISISYFSNFLFAAFGVSSSITRMKRWKFEKLNWNQSRF